MIESRLLVAKARAFLLNQSRSRLLYFSRSGEARKLQALTRLSSLRFLVLLLAKLLLLCLLLSRLLARRLKVLFARSKSFRQSERSDPTRILSAADMRLRLGDHIMP
jgi:hypothetical protein